MSQGRAVSQIRGLALCAVMLLGACADSDRPTPLSQIETIPAADTETRTNLNIGNPSLVLADNDKVAPGGAKTLVWSDEFNASRLDPKVWFFETGDGSQYGADLTGWGNDELQWYLPDNAQLSDGKLKITVRRETAGGYNYTSARINTRDRFAFRYGRIEASIKLPPGQGIWPAFWLLAQDSPYGRWAASGEIDIVEAVNLDGTGGNQIFGTIHYGGEFPANLSSETRYRPSTDVTEEFNTYAVEWDPTEIRWYVNDTLYAVKNSWSSTAAPFPAPFDQNFYIIFNVAVGGRFPGPPTGATQLPVTMEVDWVRVYSGEPDAGGGGGAVGIIPEAVVFATDPSVVRDLAPPAIDNFGSGAVFDGAFAGDADYNPAFRVTSGEGYGAGAHVGFVAFNGYAAGFASGFGTFEFKAKVNAPGSASQFEVKFINGGDTSKTYDLTTYSGSTALGNGWYQVQIPMSDFAATIAANSGFLLGPLGAQAGPFTMLLTDIGFSGTASGGGGGGAGIIPDAVVFATDPSVVRDLPPPAIDNFGSGAVFNGTFAGDADYNPAFQVTSGQGYGAGVHVGFVAFNGYAVGFAAGFGTFEFKVKVNAPGSASAFEVKFINGGDTSKTYDLTTYPGSTALGNGWYQVQIPMSDFAATIAANSGFLLGPLGAQAGPFTMLLTDIGFSGTAGGGGGCDPVGKEFAAANGDFELGNLDCWTTFNNGGTIGVVADNGPSASGSSAGRVNVTAPGNPTLKLANLGAGTLTPGQQVTVTFDWKGTDANGGVVDVVLFSEVNGGGVSKTDSILGGGGFPANWTKVGPLNLTAGADVSGGVTLQITAICGGVAGCVSEVFIDNVSIVIN
jgi:beta-glucanase (GH16 family)